MPNKQAFINTYGALAQDISGATGLDPSLVLGQLAHETGWGEHIAGNNVFGISPGGRVAAYPSVPDAAQAYVDLVNRRYPNAAGKPGVASQAEALSAGGYGPDRSYGSKIAAAAGAVQAAGYKPAASGDQADIASGQAIFERLTGQKAPGRPNEPTQTANVDVSSNDEVDRGKEIFKQITGIDPDQKPAATTGPAPGSEQPAEPAGGANAPAAGTPAADEPTATGNFLAGAQHGLNSVIQPMVAGVSNLAPVAAIDKAVPALGQLDKNYSPNPQAEAAYQQGAGNSIAGQAGNFVGQTAATLPVGMAIGGVAAPLAAGAGALTRGSLLLGTGAAQGAAGAALTGGDVKQGAIGGAVLGGVGGAANLLNGSMQRGGAVANMLQSKLADKIVQTLSMSGGVIAGGHFGFLSGLTAAAAGPVIKSALERYGPVVASGVAKAIGAANSSGAATGGAGIAVGGINTGNYLGN